MTTVIMEPGNGATAAQEPAATRFTPDAQERMARLRAMATEFPDEADPRPLTSAEIRIARQTSPAALESVAVFVENVPGVGATVTSVAELRDAIAFEISYGGVRDQARALARRIDLAILRRKLKAVKSARGLYRMAKGYVTLDVGDAVRPQVDDIKRSLTRPRRRKSSAPTEPAPAEKK